MEARFPTLPSWEPTFSLPLESLQTRPPESDNQTSWRPFRVGKDVVLWEPPISVPRWFAGGAVAATRLRGEVPHDVTVSSKRFKMIPDGEARWSCGCDSNVTPQHVSEIQTESNNGSENEFVLMTWSTNLEVPEHSCRGHVRRVNLHDGRTTHRLDNFLDKHHRLNGISADGRFLVSRNSSSSKICVADDEGWTQYLPGHCIFHRITLDVDTLQLTRLEKVANMDPAVLRFVGRRGDAWFVHPRDGSWSAWLVGETKMRKLQGSSHRHLQFVDELSTPTSQVAFVFHQDVFSIPAIVRIEFQRNGELRFRLKLPSTSVQPRTIGINDLNSRTLLALVVNLRGFLVRSEQTTLLRSTIDGTIAGFTLRSENRVDVARLVTLLPKERLRTLTLQRLVLAAVQRCPDLSAVEVCADLVPLMPDEETGQLLVAYAEWIDSNRFDPASHSLLSEAVRHAWSETT